MSKKQHFANDSSSRYKSNNTLRKHNHNKKQQQQLSSASSFERESFSCCARASNKAGRARGTLERQAGAELTMPVATLLRGGAVSAAGGARAIARRGGLSAVSSSARALSAIPVNQVASVLKLNVGDEDTAVKLDAKMKDMVELMREHKGFESATRYVCKTEWAYELSFIFATPDSFGAWKTSATRDKVHSFYLDALKDCGIKEDDVYGGARVHDKW